MLFQVTFECFLAMLASILPQLSDERSKVIRLP